MSLPFTADVRHSGGRNRLVRLLKTWDGRKCSIGTHVDVVDLRNGKEQFSVVYCSTKRELSCGRLEERINTQKIINYVALRARHK